ncbi:MAG: hypothetical protein M5U08_01285 [Burkholderiales bacterium]|nr:hypothetical protein [Burkholderiales bacterium]
MACTDSFEALARRGAQLAAALGAVRPGERDWIESPRGSRRYRLGAETDGAYLVIEADADPDAQWVPHAGAPPPASRDWLDEDAHSLR